MTDILFISGCVIGTIGVRDSYGAEVAEMILGGILLATAVVGSAVKVITSKGS